MQFTDYYEILGVKPEASEAEIKAAYRKLARKFHPDVSKEANAEERFKAVNEANEVLGDKKKRAAYDQVRAGGYRPGEEFRPPPNWGGGNGGPPYDFGEGGDAEGGFSDFFESLFGRARGAGGARPGAGAQVPRQPRRAKLEIDLEVAFAGGKRRIEIDGRMLDVTIPPGIEPGKNIRLGGQGGNGRDLILEIGYLPHARFELDGRNVIVRVPLTPWEAALGTTIEVPTLAGNVSMAIPEGSDTGRRLRLRGRGMPGGDQYVVVEVRAPKAANEAQKAAYAALQQAFAPGE